MIAVDFVLSFPLHRCLKVAVDAGNLDCLPRGYRGLYRPN